MLAPFQKLPESSFATAPRGRTMEVGSKASGFRFSQMRGASLPPSCEGVSSQPRFEPAPLRLLSRQS